MATQKSNFIQKLVKDPANPPDLVLISGYAGPSAEADSERVYTDASLSSYADIPKAVVQHQQEGAGGDFGPVQHFWVRRDAIDRVRFGSASAGPTRLQPQSPLPVCSGPTPFTVCPPTPGLPCPPSPFVRCPPSPFTFCPPSPLCPPTPATFCPPTPLTFCPPTPFCPPPTPLTHCPPSVTVVCPPSPVVVCHARTPFLPCLATVAQPCFITATCPVSASIACPTLVCPSAVDACPSAPGGCTIDMTPQVRTPYGGGMANQAGFGAMGYGFGG